MKLIVAVFTFLVCALANAGSFPSKEAAKNFPESVMKLIASGHTSEGLDLLKPYIQTPESEFEVMKEQLSLQAPAIEKRFGKSIGYELADIEEIGNSLMLVMYIQKYEKHIMRWKFYFYKPTNEWLLNTFNTDDKIQFMFNNI